MKTLLSRIFCQKSVRVNFRNFHNVQFLLSFLPFYMLIIVKSNNFFMPHLLPHQYNITDYFGTDCVHVNVSSPTPDWFRYLGACMFTQYSWLAAFLATFLHTWRMFVCKLQNDVVKTQFKACAAISILNWLFLSNKCRENKNSLSTVWKSAIKRHHAQENSWNQFFSVTSLEKRWFDEKNVHFSVLSLSTATVWKNEKFTAMQIFFVKSI